MKKYFVIVSTFLFINFFLFSFSTSRQKKIVITGVAVRELSSVDQTVSAFMTQWKIPGGSVALIKDGRLVYARGFGTADDQAPVQPNSRFRIASLSKPVTAVTIMNLMEEGKLSLSQKVFGKHGILNDEKYAQISDKRINDITVKHLLQHTAGWDRQTSPCGDPMFDASNIAKCMNAASPATPETVIRYMLGKPLDFAPGTKYAYSNFGYTVLGRIIEKITGVPYEAYVKQTILAPAGISQMEVGKNLLCDKKEDEVCYYDYSNKMIASVCEPGKKVSVPYGGFNLEAMDAHGGWIASAVDLARFLVATDGDSKKDLLSKKTARLMTEPCPVFSRYSCGWFVNSRNSRWHTGCLPGASSMMAQIQNGTGWVILFNTYPGTKTYSKEMDRLMWNALEGVDRWPEHDLFKNADRL